MFRLVKRALFLGIVIALGLSLAGTQAAAAQSPNNDLFQDAIQLTLPLAEGIGFEPLRNTISAGLEGGEPTPGCISNNWNYPYIKYTVWYQVTASQAADLMLTLTTNYSSYPVSLALYHGTELGDLQEVLCQYDSFFWEPGYIRYTMQAGETVYMQLGWPELPWDMFFVTFGAPPVNDSMYAPMVIPTMGTYPGDSYSASLEAGEPLPDCLPEYTNSNATVWYSFTAPADQVYFFQIPSYYNGTPFLGLYDTSYARLGCATGNSSITITLHEGDQVYVQVGDLYKINGSGFSLKIMQLPFNDHFEGAQNLYMLPSYFDVDLGLSTYDVLDPPTSCTWGNILEQTLWYKFTPEQSMTMMISVASANDYPFIVVYKGEQLDEQACFQFDYSNKMRTVALEANTQYYFMFGTLWGGTTNTLTFELPPINDAQAGALPLTEYPSTLKITNTKATTDPLDPPISCGTPWSAPGNTLWYKITPSESRTLWFDLKTSWYPTVYLSVYEVNEGGGLEELGCKSSEYYPYTLPVSMQAGKTYLLQFGSGNGTFTDYAVDIIVPPAHDALANALPITVEDGYIPVDLTFFSQETGEPTPSVCWQYYYCGEYTHSAWFKFSSSTEASYYISNGGYSAVGIYTGEWGALNEVEHWFPGSIMFHAVPGQTYYIQLFGRPDSYYNAGISVNLVPDPYATWIDKYPYDPNIYDDITFCIQDWNITYLWSGVKSIQWDFGDGTSTTAAGNCTTHRYSADNESGYPITATFTTLDGRTGSYSTTQAVITRNVAITKFVPPDTGRAGMTKVMYVYVANPSKYTSKVKVILYRSTPNGYVQFGELIQQVVPGSLNKPVRFTFSYTFTQEDAAAGSMTFMAEAIILDPNDYYNDVALRDAVPANNTVTSPLIRVR